MDAVSGRFLLFAAVGTEPRPLEMLGQGFTAHPHIQCPPEPARFS